MHGKGKQWMTKGIAGAALAIAATLAGCAGTPKGPARYEISVGTEGYSPAAVKAKQGQEVILVFTRTTDATCGTEVVIPSENDRTVPLPLNQPVEVRILPKEKGEIAFTCGMKMFEGKIEVD
jgi:plastocyanin domain-containing protein